MKHLIPEEIPTTHKHDHPDYEYYRKKMIPFGSARNTVVSIYEIPPLKSPYPYHYHEKNEETFYILSGEGLLRTIEGERKVKAGDFLFFPTGPDGAHKIANTSSTEPLIYIDFDVVHEIDIALYPDSGKIGIWGKEINRIFLEKDDVAYYTGE